MCLMMQFVLSWQSVLLFPAKEKDFFVFSKRLSGLLGPPVLFNGRFGLRPQGQNDLTVRLTTHLHLMPSLTISAAKTSHPIWISRLAGGQIRPFTFAPCLFRRIIFQVTTYRSLPNEKKKKSRSHTLNEGWVKHPGFSLYVNNSNIIPNL